MDKQTDKLDKTMYPTLIGYIMGYKDKFGTYHKQLAYYSSLANDQGKYRIAICNQDYEVVSVTGLVSGQISAIRAANRKLFRNYPSIGSDMAIVGDYSLWCETCAIYRYGATAGLDYEGSELSLAQNYSDLKGQSCEGYSDCETSWD